MTAVLSSQIDVPVERGSLPGADALPKLAAIIRRLATQLLIACVIPGSVFTGLMFLAGLPAALLGALFWSYCAVGWQIAKRCRRSGLLIVTSAVLTVRTLVALASGDTLLYFLQPIATDAVISAIFFTSLATSRPMVARLAGDFYPMTEELASRPPIRRLFGRLTALWAMLALIKASVVFWLLQSQSVETFVVAKNAFVFSMNGLAIAVTLGSALFVARREGLIPSHRAGEEANIRV
ncbi:MAG TPA: VC0807 family protein [Nocardioidaceae bacterium]